MKKTWVSGMLWMVFLMGLSIPAWAGENQKHESLLTVPWDEFRELLPLGQDDIVLPMETFQKLLVCSGMAIKPEHTLKQGNVVLTKDEFKTMIENLKPAVQEPEENLPFDYLITRAVYQGTVKNNAVSFTGTFDFHVLSKGDFIKIPLLPQSVALDGITLDGQKALVVMENGYHHVMLSTRGEHTATVSFSLKPAMTKGANRIDLAIQQTPMTLLTLGLPLENAEVIIPQAQHIQSTSRDKNTQVSANITPGRMMNISWKKKETPSERIPPKLYSEICHFVSIDDDALNIHSEITYTIFHSEVNGVTIQVPLDMNVLQVAGEAVGEWRETVEDDRRVLFVPFTYGQKGRATVTVQCEKPLTGDSMTQGFAGVQTLGTVHETGFIGMELNTGSEVNIVEKTGLESIGTRKLPQSLYQKSDRPLMYAFKYVKPPFSLSFDTKKHRKVAVPVAAIDSANMVTLFTEDGKVVDHLVYHVKNSAKQFMKITLPESADVWSVFVDSKPVESSLDARGRLLVPLIRSHNVNNSLSSFPVEVIYCRTGDTFALSGTRESQLPGVDLLISRLIWSVYLPNDYSYPYFDSTLEKEEMIRGVNVFPGSQRKYSEKAMVDMYDSVERKAGMQKRVELGKVYEGKDYTSRFKNLPLSEEQITSQVEAELHFSGRLRGAQGQTLVSGGDSGTGVMPIQIQIPTGGQVYRFARTLIKQEDPLNIRVMYSSNRITRIAGWAVVGLFGLIAYRKRKTIMAMLEALKKSWDAMDAATQKNREGLQNIARSGMMPFILAGLTIVCFFISGALALLVFFLFWVSVAYGIVQRRKRKKAPSALPEDETQSPSL